MFIPFEDISVDARVWVYQLNRSLNADEKKTVESTIEAFCQAWQAHGAPLTTSYHLAHDQFLILAVDEASGGASGCSIDGSVRVLKELSNQLGIDFFERTKAAFLVDHKISVYPLSQLKELFTDGTLKANDIAFNNLVTTKGELLRSWKVPASQSWLSKYLPKKALA